MNTKKFVIHIYKEFIFASILFYIVLKQINGSII